MPFYAHDVAIELAEAMRAPLDRLRLVDPEAEKDLRRATRSIGHNVAEGMRRVGKDRIHHYRIAEGSASEVRTGLRIALAFGQLTAAEVERPIALADRECRLLYGLTRRRPG